MTTTINLNKARKANARKEAKRQADENAARHGLSKAQRLLNATRNEKARIGLDRHQIDSENDLEG